MADGTDATASTASPVQGGELKPCPFDGATGEEVSLYEEGPEWFVRCHVCCVETARADTEAEAIAAWNRRSTPARGERDDALEEIAAQRLSTDMDTDEWTNADFEGAYDKLIEVARAALLKSQSPGRREE